MDKHGNINAVEGCTLCACGAKYWENDKCVSCGMGVEIAQIKILARNYRYLGAVQRNVAFSTMTYYMGMTDAPVTDLTTINERFNVVDGHIYGGII